MTPPTRAAARRSPYFTPGTPSDRSADKLVPLWGIGLAMILAKATKPTSAPPPVGGPSVSSTSPERERRSAPETRPIHFNARVISELLPRTRALGSTLCVASSMLWVAVFVDFLSAASLWAMLAAVAAFVSEMNERYVFFTASGSKRMPGGIGS